MNCFVWALSNSGRISNLLDASPKDQSIKIRPRYFYSEQPSSPVAWACNRNTTFIWNSTQCSCVAEQISKEKTLVMKK